MTSASTDSLFPECFLTPNITSLVSKVIENIQHRLFIVMMPPTKYPIMTADLFRKQIKATAKSHDIEKEKNSFFFSLFL